MAKVNHKRATHIGAARDSQQDDDRADRRQIDVDEFDGMSVDDLKRAITHLCRSLPASPPEGSVRRRDPHAP